MPKLIDVKEARYLIAALANLARKIPIDTQLSDPRLVSRADDLLKDWGDSRIGLGFEYDELNSLQLSNSDLLCWHAGFAAARDGAYPLGVHGLREFNIAIKRALED